ncbi:hypothetical protein, unlikely [Trypanosoma brucei gambiense DAL972]|uniref:Uncharacterized protein n=1 Tax=Trypanosoma brucei gambiense (strain MHOM/CI/86/DAL972) TaxID=679716 RepID=C9ZU50_TRYB9|nr:hypothetical protein, unlikely [Trypanosoma brucei gambiense DAL972]CBH12936.1 hypothetical protein, unlikely [Trypanosoma brucei gambiense DAL972]|eukprot:XP_011775215.1 hypothetical protein, unlikely [Trypanosoma brucei gambiense DAL972]
MASVQQAEFVPVQMRRSQQSCTVEDSLVLSGRAKTVPNQEQTNPTNPLRRTKYAPMTPTTAPWDSIQSGGQTYLQAVKRGVAARNSVRVASTRRTAASKARGPRTATLNTRKATQGGSRIGRHGQPAN